MTTNTAAHAAAGRLLCAALTALLLLAAMPASAATFLVTSTNDSGMGSLRQAILDANALDGEDRIEFAITGPGPYTIAPLTPLPALRESAVIDGYSQPGAVPATATAPATLKIVINGENVTGPSFERQGLSAFPANPTDTLHLNVRGLVIHTWATCVALNTASSQTLLTVVGSYIGVDYSGSSRRLCGDGIQMSGGLIGGSDPADRNLIVADAIGILSSFGGPRIIGNFFGTDATGTIALADGGGTGLTVRGGTIIGGTEPGEGNLISGWRTGIASETGVTILGNRIGTDVTGTMTLPNLYGIRAGQNNIIGGATPGSGNLISGNSGFGVLTGFESNQRNRIQGNLIGTDASGKLPLGNGSAGVLLFTPHSNLRIGANMIGGTVPGEGNVIAFNGGPGVLVEGNFGGRPPMAQEGSRENSIIGNAIFANAGLGIDLSTRGERLNEPAADGVTDNDPGDADSFGANRLQNYPVLTTAATNGTSSITVGGLLNSTPGTTGFRVEFFASTVCNAIQDGSPDPDMSENFGEGETFLGATSVDTDASGDAQFSVALDGAVPGGHFITATATGPDGTSEFSQCIVAEHVVTCEAWTGKVTGGGRIGGDAGEANFGFNAKRKSDGDAVKGRFNYVNHDSGLHLRGDVMTLEWCSDDSVEFSGECDAKSGPCVVSIRVEDGDPDTFAIEASGDVATSHGGPLTGGNIHIHD